MIWDCNEECQSQFKNSFRSSGQSTATSYVLMLHTHKSLQILGGYICNGRSEAYYNCSVLQKLMNFDATYCIESLSRADEALTPFSQTHHTFFFTTRTTEVANNKIHYPIWPWPFRNDKHRLCLSSSWRDNYNGKG